MNMNQSQQGQSQFDPRDENRAGDTILALLLAIPSTFLRAFALKTLWFWFILPIAPSVLMAIGAAQALGIGTLATLFIVVRYTPVGKVSMTWLIVEDILRCAFALLFGLIFHIIMLR